MKRFFTVLCACACSAAFAGGKAVQEMNAEEMMQAEHLLRSHPASQTEQLAVVQSGDSSDGIEGADTVPVLPSINIRQDPSTAAAAARVRDPQAKRRYLDEVIAIDLLDQPFEVVLQAISPLGWQTRVQVKRPGFAERLFSVTAENRRGEVLATIQRATGVRFHLYPSHYLVLVTD